MTQETDFSPRLIARIQSRLAGDESVPDIARAEGVTVDDVLAIRSAILDDHRAAYCSRPDDEVYVEFLSRSRANVAQLEEVIPELREHKQGVAVVGAIKAKQAILERVLEIGQSMGFVKRVPRRHEIAVLTANLTSHELREAALAEVQRIQALVASDRDLLDVSEPVAALPAPVAVAAMQPRSTSKPTRAARAVRRTAGR
ncbi:MAG: hypothetical protein ABIK89_04755 [Planctomycetota bacterium]